jgi:fatty-acid desaturase
MVPPHTRWGGEKNNTRAQSRRRFCVATLIFGKSAHGTHDQYVLFKIFRVGITTWVIGQESKHE